LTYLVFPALIWAALRFGQRGATLAVAVAVGLGVWNITHFAGPFFYNANTQDVLRAQLYIAVAALSTLCLAAVVSEREEFAERLGASRARLFDAAEGERRRIERNLHDGAQQRLLALAVHLRLAAEQAQQAPDQSPALFAAAEEELTLAFDELRQLAQGIHPAVLTSLGLANAVQTLAARSTVPVRLIELPSTRLDETAEATAYYVLAEAVTNAQKYARASAIGIRAAVVGDTLHVEVLDDGVGGAAESPGSGLEGLRYRVEAVDGTFELQSTRARGTRVAAAIPTLPRESP
jgi:signal transduction histidine kinase